MEGLPTHSDSVRPLPCRTVRGEERGVGILKSYTNCIEIAEIKFITDVFFVCIDREALFSASRQRCINLSVGCLFMK